MKEFRDKETDTIRSNLAFSFPSPSHSYLWVPEEKPKQFQQNNTTSLVNIECNTLNMTKPDNFLCRPANNKFHWLHRIWGSHSSDYEEFCPLGYNAMQSGESQPTFQRLAWLTLWPWRWRQYVAPKCQFTFTRLHGIISQMTELFTDFLL
jgi:hypothetical protein